jgi:hypothetical protein
MRSFWRWCELISYTTLLLLYFYVIYLTTAAETQKSYQFKYPILRSPPCKTAGHSDLSMSQLALVRDWDRLPPLRSRRRRHAPPRRPALAPPCGRFSRRSVRLGVRPQGALRDPLAVLPLALDRNSSYVLAVGSVEVWSRIWLCRRVGTRPPRDLGSHILAGVARVVQGDGLVC